MQAVGKTRDVREAVEKELSYDPRVDTRDISVKNINGEVALTGRVPSYPQYLEAAQAAWRVAGVTKVHNHLEVMLPPSAVRDDAMLTTAANNALAADATVPSTAARWFPTTATCWSTPAGARSSSLATSRPGQSATPSSAPHGWRAASLWSSTSSRSAGDHR